MSSLSLSPDSGKCFPFLVIKFTRLLLLRGKLTNNLNLLESQGAY